jgi:L-ascorbate metabolism protein UlaG (beta-lactamase superfamily)
MDSVRLLTDPLLRSRIVHLRHRHGPIDPVAVQNIDAVIISHLHFDHLDPPSLRMLGTSTRLIVPRGAARLLGAFTNVEELGVGDSTVVGNLTLKATYAHHARERYPFGPAADCLGFIVEGCYRLYFAGDTDLFPGMEELDDDLDVALLPVWGWGPTLGKGHMDPRRAARALTLLHPRLAVPIHWGTLHPVGFGWLKPRFLKDPPHLFVRHAAQLAPEVKTQIVLPGQNISLAEMFDRA